MTSELLYIIKITRRRRRVRQDITD